MPVKFLIKQILKAGFCCFILSLSTISSARADVCFLPKGYCENQTRTDTPCSLEYRYSENKGEGWICEECGGKWKCEKENCAPGYNTDISCTKPGETKKCEGKSGDKQCCKCADEETECFHEGYIYKKTSSNERCSNACPYNGDYYEICYCNSKYDKDRTEKCYEYDTCELGDLANTKKYQQKSSTKQCESYEDNSSYNKTGDEILNNNDYTCVSKCEEKCTGITYYECSPKVTDACADGPYSWRDTECCSKTEWKDTKYCKKPTCTITAGGKNFTEILYPSQVSDFVPTKCDERLKNGLGIGHLQYGCYSRRTNYVLGMIRYCGGINDFAGLDDLNTLANEMYNQNITNNKGAGVYASCEIPASSLPWYENLTVKNTELYNKIKLHASGRLTDFWINVRECYNGDESGMVNFFFNGSGSDKYGVYFAPVLSSNGYNRGMCICETAVDCTGCEYCIPSTCKDSGENRIISDSSTYEACGSECNGKYRCKSGYTPEYAGSNQYRCVASGGDDCAVTDRNLGAKFLIDCNPVNGAGKIICTYTITGAVNPEKYKLRVYYHKVNQTQNNIIDLKPNFTGSQQITVGVAANGQTPGGIDKCEIVIQPNDASPDYSADPVISSISDCSHFNATMKEDCTFSTGGNSGYATIRLSRDGGSDWPNASTTMMSNPIIDICGHSYDLTGEISTKPAEFLIAPGECEILYGGAWYGNGRCYKQGRIILNGLETLDFTGTYQDNGSQDFNGCTCHSTVGRQVYNFESGRTYNILVHSAAAECGSGSGGNNKVTVYYDAPTDCNPILIATNSANGHNTSLVATNQMEQGTYTLSFATNNTGNGTGSSFTIRMGSGGTPSSPYSSGRSYTFSAGNEYWIVPSCTSGGNSGGDSGGGSGGDSGGGSSGGSTTSCSGARPVKFTNIPMTSSSTTCIDVCCGPNADVPSSYSYLGDCNSVGSTYTCPPTTSSILCYRDVQGILHETDGVETGGDSARHCVPGWIQVPHYTKCEGSYMLGCNG